MSHEEHNHATLTERFTQITPAANVCEPVAAKARVIDPRCLRPKCVPFFFRDTIRSVLFGHFFFYGRQGLPIENLSNIAWIPFMSLQRCSLSCLGHGIARRRYRESPREERAS